MKKIILILLVLLTILFSGFIFNDMKRDIETREKLTNEVDCFFGDANSCFYLVWGYIGMSQDEKIKAYEKLCEQDNQSDACYHLAKIYSFAHKSTTANGDDYRIVRDSKKATYYYDRACNFSRNALFDTTSSCSDLGYWYKTGQIKSSRNSRIPFQIGTQSEKIDRNFEKSIYYYELGCKNGNSWICRILGVQFLEGIFKPIKNGEFSSKFTSDIASTYSDEKTIAKIYFRWGCNDDFIKKIPGSWADEINYSALQSCELLYELDNVEHKEKNKIYERLCAYSLSKEGKFHKLYPHGKVCYLNGLLYLEGKGIKQDYLKAKEYFGHACDLGLKEGCSEYAKLNIK